MQTPSIAVVGAGPAGATAARLLASRGARVTLLDARRLPRPTACGGGLTPKAQRLVPPTALETVERRVHRVELRGGLLPALRLDEPEAEIAMVDRGRFDMALTEIAAKAGSDVRDDERVDAVAEDPSGVTLTTRSGRIRADAVVAADGDPSGIARRLGLGGPAVRHALALEVDLPLSCDAPPDTAILSFAIRGGYAWYFPKSDHANVGAGSYRETNPASLKASLVRFARGLGLDPTHARIAGHWIPQGLRRGALASARVALAGDAAATADPLFGEGIAYAIVSGIAAADAIADRETGRATSLRPYDRRLRELLGPPLHRLELAALAIEASMTLALGAIRLSDAVRGIAIDAIAGRRPPFAVDGRCELACACGIDHDQLVLEDDTKPCPHRMPGADGAGTCHVGPGSHLACGSCSSPFQPRPLQWMA